MALGYKKGEGVKRDEGNVPLIREVDNKEVEIIPELLSL